MSNPIESKRVLLGVTGSIACYKAADLASKLTQSGALVDVILTGAATRFLTPLTFESVTGRQAYTDEDLWGGEGHVLHIGLGHSADLLVIAPASANTLAKLAHGLADNLLTVTALAARCPVLVAPAMDGGMYAHPATQANVVLLKQRGLSILGPVEGHLASGLAGIGRMMEPVDLLGQIRLVLGKSGRLRGRKLVVTAGGTQEAIDPVRLIANRSSGKQGFALAQAALDMGADVTLIAGNTCLNEPVGVQRIDVGSAEEMLVAVLAALPGADALLMAAAVADFKPRQVANQKIKRQTGAPVIELDLAVDILRAVADYKSQHGFPRMTVGFAAESQALVENARAKLAAKKLDMIVANDISATDAGFAVDDNRVTLLDATGGVEPLPLMSKTRVAEVVLARTADLLGASS
jgi:phosphopantothenoylcysteine decarboxylase/phosphopantothenate--cysteine ligase